LGVPYGREFRYTNQTAQRWAVFYWKELRLSVRKHIHRDLPPSLGENMSETQKQLPAPPPRTATLSFHELRAVVIALHDHGTSLRQDHLTFSHGNTGHDWIKLASKLDHLVSELEAHSIIRLSDLADLMKENLNYVAFAEKMERVLGNLEEKLQFFQNQLTASQALTDKIKAKTGTYGLPDDQVLADISVLVDAYNAKTWNPKPKAKKRKK
jgi:hypothetical protein